MTVEKPITGLSNKAANDINAFSASGDNSIKSIKLKSDRWKPVPSNESLSSNWFFALLGDT